jgi:diguanylate cyclase (GGDEF)-like protein
MAVDGKAGVRLKLFVSFVVVGALACLVWAASRLSAPPSWLHLVAVTSLVAVAQVCSARLRIRGEPYSISCSSSSLLVALAVLPAPWAIVCVAVGVLITQIATSRYTAEKIAFNTAAHTIGVTAANAAVVVCGLAPGIAGLAGSPAGWARQFTALVIAAVAYAMTEEALTPTVIALASGLSWRTVAGRELAIRSAIRLANLVLAGAAVAVLAYRIDLVLALPLAVVTVHLASSQRLRVRAEQRAGHQLALATAALANTDPAVVAQHAALAAIRLLSAAEAEIETTAGTADSGRLVRVRADTVVYDGPALDAPPAADADTTSIALGGEGDGAGQSIGFLRLRFKVQTALNESEQDTLRTFASAVSIALANAAAYQSAVRVAGARDHDATHDALTGLGNRRALEEYGALLAGRSGLHAVALFDLNHFKQVNDTLGHTAGDLLLIGVARRIEAAALPTDLVTRLGGDEFAVVLTELAAPAHAVSRTEALLQALAEPVDVHGIPVTVEVAVGLAGGPVVGGLPELLRRADLAMYQAKRQRRAIVRYQPERHDLPEPESGAVLTAGSDTRLTYQPIVDLGTAQIVGARAVTSWQRFRHLGGLRQEPVEQTGAGPAYTNHLLGQALHAAAAWRAAGFDLPVAVHVPARSLLDPGFVDAVTERMASTATPLGGLTIELTETLVHSNLAIVRTALRRLVDLGVRLALDEFGATSSPLASLAHAPIHEITVSRALVGRLTDPEAIAITRSVLDLGRNLDLQVTADGVESEAQRTALWELGCTAGRGSLFGKSLTHERLLEVLRGGHDGRPGSLGTVLHQPGTVIRLTEDRRAAGNLR